MKENELDGAFSTYVRNVKGIHSLTWKTSREEITWLDQGVDGRIILNYILEK
jgi:hypothetical protein